MDQVCSGKPGVKSGNVDSVDQDTIPSRKRIHVDDNNDPLSPPTKRMHNQFAPSYATLLPSLVDQTQNKQQERTPQSRDWFSQQERRQHRDTVAPTLNNYRYQQIDTNNMNTIALPLETNTRLFARPEQYAPSPIPLLTKTGRPIPQVESSARRRPKRKQKLSTLSLSLRLFGDERFSDITMEKPKTTTSNRNKNNAQQPLQHTFTPTPPSPSLPTTAAITTTQKTRFDTSPDGTYSGMKSPAPRMGVDIHGAPYLEPAFEPYDPSLFDNYGLLPSVNGDGDGGNDGETSKDDEENGIITRDIDKSIESAMKHRLYLMRRKLPWNTILQPKASNFVTRLSPIPSLNITKYATRHPQVCAIYPHSKHIMTFLGDKLTAQREPDTPVATIIQDMQSLFENNQVLLSRAQVEGSLLEQLVGKYGRFISNLMNQRLSEYEQMARYREIEAYAKGEQMVAETLHRKRQQRLLNWRKITMKQRNHQQSPLDHVYLKHHSFFDNLSSALNN